MSLNEEWAGDLGDVELTYLYRICNPLIEDLSLDAKYLRSKGEQDTAWAVKHEYERRSELQKLTGEHGVF